MSRPYSASLVEEAVGNRSAAAVVADTLRSNILHHSLAGGERLRQDAVATRFGVSQMVVREAFRQLVTEGLLRSEPRRGVSVAEMSPREADEMTRLRCLIEAQALEWAIPQMARADHEEAARLLSELDAADEVDVIIRLNAQFHRTLYAPAKRERTLALIETLRTNFERYLRYTWEETPHREQSQREHRQILDQCKRGAIEAASETLRRHIAATGSLLVERLESRDS